CLTNICEPTTITPRQGSSLGVERRHQADRRNFRSALEPDLLGTPWKLDEFGSGSNGQTIQLGGKLLSEGIGNRLSLGLIESSVLLEVQRLNMLGEDGDTDQHR